MILEYETASTLFHHYNSPTIPFQLQLSNKLYTLSTNELLEIQTQSADISGAILDIILQYVTQNNQSGLIIHISFTSNLFMTLDQSNFDIPSSPLSQFCQNNRLISLQINNYFELMSFLDSLYISDIESPLLLLFENYNAVLLSHNGNKNIESFLNKLSSLREVLQVITIWICPVSSKNAGSLRDGYTQKDPMSLLWKEAFKKLILY